MVFDGTITLGAILQIVVMAVALIIGWIKLDRKLTSFALNLDHHAQAIEKHTARLDAVEGRLFIISGDLQRLIGRSERFSDEAEKLR